MGSSSRPSHYWIGNCTISWPKSHALSMFRLLYTRSPRFHPAHRAGCFLPWCTVRHPKIPVGLSPACWLFVGSSTTASNYCMTSTPRRPIAIVALCSFSYPFVQYLVGRWQVVAAAAVIVLGKRLVEAMTGPQTFISCRPDQPLFTTSQRFLPDEAFLALQARWDRCCCIYVKHHSTRNGR